MTMADQYEEILASVCGVPRVHLGLGEELTDANIIKYYIEPMGRRFNERKSDEEKNEIRIMHAKLDKEEDPVKKRVIFDQMVRSEQYNDSAFSEDFRMELLGKMCKTCKRVTEIKIMRGGD